MVAMDEASQAEVHAGDVVNGSLLCDIHVFVAAAQRRIVAVDEVEPPGALDCAEALVMTVAPTSTKTLGSRTPYPGRVGWRPDRSPLGAVCGRDAP